MSYSKRRAFRYASRRGESLWPRCIEKRSVRCSHVDAQYTFPVKSMCAALHRYEGTFQTTTWYRTVWRMAKARPLDFRAIRGVFHFVYLSLSGSCATLLDSTRSTRTLLTDKNDRQCCGASSVFIWHISRAYALETIGGWTSDVFVHSCALHVEFTVSAPLSRVFYLSSISSLAIPFECTVWMWPHDLLSLFFFRAATCNTDVLPFCLIRTQFSLCIIIGFIV